MMTLAGARAKCLAGGSPHERRVRPHLVGWLGFETKRLPEHLGYFGSDAAPDSRLYCS